MYSSSKNVRQFVTQLRMFVFIFIGWLCLQCPVFAGLKHCVRCSYSQALYLSSDDNDLKPCKIDKNLVISITTALTASLQHCSKTKA